MTRPLQLPASELGYHPRFRPRRFRALVQFHGRNVLLEREASCPCRKVTGSLGNETGLLSVDTTVGDEVGGEHTVDCPDCGGTGSVFVLVCETRAIVTGDSRRGFRERDGSSLSGEAMFTFLPEAMPAYLDRIVLTDAYEKFSEMTKRRGVIDRLRYPIVPRIVVAGQASQPTEPVYGTEAVIYLQTTGASGLPVGEVRRDGVDFDITPDGCIDHTRGDLLGTAPAVGANYSVTAWTQARYVITESPEAHRAQTTDYPGQVDATDPASTQMLVGVKAKLEIAGPPPGSSA